MNIKARMKDPTKKKPLALSLQPKHTEASPSQNKRISRLKE